MTKMKLAYLGNRVIPTPADPLEVSWKKRTYSGKRPDNCLTYCIYIYIFILIYLLAFHLPFAPSCILIYTLTFLAACALICALTFKFEMTYLADDIGTRSSAPHSLLLPHLTGVFCSRHMTVFEAMKLLGTSASLLVTSALR